MKNAAHDTHEPHINLDSFTVNAAQHMDYLWMFHSPRDVILTLGMPVDVPKS